MECLETTCLFTGKWKIVPRLGHMPRVPDICEQYREYASCAICQAIIWPYVAQKHNSIGNLRSRNAGPFSKSFKVLGSV